MKVEYFSKWVSVLSNSFKGEKYYFLHEQDKVMILPYYFDEEGNLQIVFLVEPVSIWGRKREITAVCGTIEVEEDPNQAAPRELYEETGFKLEYDKDRWTSLGRYNTFKGSDRRCFYYLVDVNGVMRQKKTTDGSEFEKNTLIIISDPKLLTFSTDVHLHLLYSKLQDKLLNEQEEISENNPQRATPLPLSNKVNITS